MAIFKNARILQQNSSSVFDTIHAPGSATPHSGIYRCEGCGKEVVSETSRPLPPQNHHQHTTFQGAIRWRLAVLTQSQAA